MSTLHVENLKGLSSGSNANKVIIPSGQTLVPSAGQVIQKVHHTWNSDTVASSNSSWTDVGNSSLSFTPKLATSRLFITAHYHMNSYSSENYAGGMCTIVHDGTRLDYTSQWYETYYESHGGNTTASNIHARQSKCMTVASGNTNARTIKLQLIKYSASTAAQVNQGAYFYSTIIVEEVVQ